jgi:hypothetical protein
MISEYYTEKWNDFNAISGIGIDTFVPIISGGSITQISRIEFDSLRKDVQEMRELLTKALAYDRMTNQAECSNEEKLDRLEKIAQFAGIDCTDLFKELRKIHAKKPRKRRVRRVKKSS